MVIDALKTCFKCADEKPRTEFYKHPQMGDGLLGKCKECTKKDVRQARNRRVDYYRAYDRARGGRQTKERLASYKAAHPGKAKARMRVGNAVRDGRLLRAPCMICGRKDVHAHHDNYDRPLDVVWLCPAHHFQRHGELKKWQWGDY